MKTGNELRDYMFPQFLDFLRRSEIEPDHFGKDAWSAIILAELKKKFDENAADVQIAGKVIATLSIEQLENILTDRKTEVEEKEKASGATPSEPKGLKVVDNE